MLSGQVRGGRGASSCTQFGRMAEPGEKKKQKDDEKTSSPGVGGALSEPLRRPHQMSTISFRSTPPADLAPPFGLALTPLPGEGRKGRHAGQAAPRVLLVDDEPDNLVLLGTVLEDTCEVHTAPDGAQALALLDRLGECAVVIADQRMPGMTGVALLTEIARRAPRTVRMVLTAYSDIEPIVAAINQGSVYRFLLKPWDAAEMRAAVADGVWLREGRAMLDRLVKLLVGRRNELAAALEDLRRSEESLVAAERMSTLGRFTSGITHNIRNNLTVMTNVLELVRESRADAATLRITERALATLSGVLGIVKDIGALARGELLSISRTTVPVAPFLEDVVRAFRAEMDGGEVRVGPVARGADVLRFDRLRVRQALIALLRHFAEGRPPGVALELGVEGGAFVLRGSLPASGTKADPDPERSGLDLEIARVVAQGHEGHLEVRRASSGVTARLWLGSAAEPGGQT